MTTTEPKRQVFIDASALKKATCFRHLWWTIFYGYKHGGEKAHKMAFGSAIHLFLEDIYKGKTVKEGIVRAVEYYQPYHDTLDLTVREFRTIPNLIKTCQEYVKAHNFKNDSIIFSTDFEPHTAKDGSKLVEYKFAIPIWTNAKYELILSGTIDLIAKTHGLPLVLVDHKTTALANKPEFFKPYEWEVQPMLYSKVWKEANKLDFYPPFMINGIFCKKPTEIAAEKGEFDGVSFNRSSLMQFAPDKMREFDIWLSNQIYKVVGALTEITENPNYDPALDYNMAACHSAYGMCKYFSACKLTKQYQKNKLETSYTKELYNPLTFRD